MSFQIAIPQNRRAAARFVGKVRRALQEALSDNPDVKRTDIADTLGVHRSVITRQLNGKKDMSLGRVAELAWAMGYSPKLVLEPINSGEPSNFPKLPIPAKQYRVQTSTSTGSGSVTRTAKPKQMELA